jgi:hypothetical protein
LLLEFGEKNNSYFLGMEKQRQIKKSINKLIDENNEILTDQMHILSTIKSYYEKLYTTKYPDENLTSNYIFNTKLENRLQDQDQSICDGKVTEEECSNAINNMNFKSTFKREIGLLLSRTKGSPFLNNKDKTLVR